MESSLVDGGAAVLAPEIMEELGPAPLPHSPPALRPAAARPLWEPPSAATRGQAATRLRESIFRRMLLLADVLAICGSLLLTVGLYSHALPLPPGSVLVVALLLVAAKVSGLYDRDDTLLRKTTLEELPRLFQLATLGALAAWLSGGLVLVGAPSRAEGLFLWLTLAFTFVLGRTLARALALRLAPVERCMFIGPADVSETVACKLSGHGGIRARLVAVLDFDEIGPWSAQAQAIGRLAEIRELARTLDVQRAIVAPRGGDAAEVLDLVRTLKAVGVRVSILPRVLEVVGSSVEFDDLHGVTVMGVRRFHLTRSSAAVKRSFDLILASLGLVALAPLMALVAIAIKLDSRGPVFFRQLRVGRHAERFRIVKFRTMVDGADALKDSLRERNEARGGLFKIADDPRVTRVGRVLRRTALDELPQLLNVVKGEMSLVGPRPLVVDEDVRVQGWHRRRLELTPGMTGHWQILGPARVPLTEMVAIDYLYVANWSLWTDAKILLRTIPCVLGARGL